MLRSVDFPVDPRWIKNPTNDPLATPGARMAAAARTRLCIETIGLILSEHFKRPCGWIDVPEKGCVKPNLWTVRLTRISMGTVDPITGGATMKAVQDAVARWCDVPNERDPIWHWVEPIGQEKRGFVKGADGSKRAWTGVRIEIEDLAPGEPRRVVLATIAGFEVRAKAAIKERAKAAKMRGRTQVYHAAEGQKAASSAARGRAEEAFAKVTGKRVERSINIVHMKHTATPEPMAHRDPVPKAATPEQRARVFAELRAAGSEDASPRMLVACRVHDADPGEWCDAERKTICATRKRLAGLAVAAARVLAPKPASGPKKKAQRIPEDLAAMRAQARSVACPFITPGGIDCGAVSDAECVTRPTDAAQPFEYGVHASRARAAGLPPFPCVADLDAGAKPVRVETRCTTCGGDGFRMRMIEGPQPCRCDFGKVSTWTWLPGRGAEVWLILPWSPPDKRFTRETRLPDPPPDTRDYREHDDAPAVTLHRTTFTTRAGRLAWLFTTEERTRS